MGKKEDLHATFLSIKMELVMLENVIHLTKSHIVWTLECRCGLLIFSQSLRVLSEREWKSCPWCWTHRRVEGDAKWKLFFLCLKSLLSPLHQWWAHALTPTSISRSGHRTVKTKTGAWVEPGQPSTPVSNVWQHTGADGWLVLTANASASHRGVVFLTRRPQRVTTIPLCALKIQRYQMCLRVPFKNTQQERINKKQEVWEAVVSKQKVKSRNNSRFRNVLSV